MYFFYKDTAFATISYVCIVIIERQVTWCNVEYDALCCLDMGDSCFCKVENFKCLCTGEKAWLDSFHITVGSWVLYWNQTTESLDLSLELMFFDSGNKRADRRAAPLQRDQARCAEEILIGCREIMMEQSEIWRSDVIPWTVRYCNMFCVEWRVYIHDMLSACTCCLYIWDTAETLSRD